MASLTSSSRSAWLNSPTAESVVAVVDARRALSLGASRVNPARPLPAVHADGRRSAPPEYRLTAPDTAVSHLPRPGAAIIGMRQLQRPYPVPVELYGGHQVRRRLRHLDALDQRAAAQRDLLARPG